MDANIRMWAANELLKRYMLFRKSNIVKYEVGGVIKRYNEKLIWDKQKQENMVKECLAICSDAKTSAISKKAARTLLDLIMGRDAANDMLEGIAIVTDRNDPLVKRWRKNVLTIYKYCVICGSEKNLHAHHISEWSDDPINRINVDNGITLCVECHAKQHPELRNLILSRI